MTPNILCPVDFSKHSRRALREALSVAARSGGPLTVLFVEDPLLFAAESHADEAAGLAKLRGQLHVFVQRSLRNRPLPVSVRLEVAVGDAAREIQRIAHERGCNLIVMGSHGLTGLTRFMMGSTTEKVLRHATVPVLAIPPARHMAVAAFKARRPTLKRA